MTEEKIKHLDFIQNVITRMNGNSFSLKNYCVTILAALVALLTQITLFREEVIFAGLFIILVFWYLDGSYLSLERCYRALFNDVVTGTKKDFDMNASNYAKGNNTILRSMFSYTLIPFYGILILGLVGLLYYITRS